MSPPRGALLRTVVRIAAVAGGVASVALTLRAGGATMPPLVMVLMTIWVLLPFVVLIWANTASLRWSAATQVTLQCVTLILLPACLILYGELIARPAGSPRGFVYVIVPPASLLFMAIVVGMAAFISRKRSARVQVGD